MNAAFSAVGALALTLDRTTPLVDAGLKSRQSGIAVAAFVVMLGIQAIIRQKLLSGKTKNGF